MRPARPAPVKVWDLPTRLFHWSLLALVLLAWRTAETRDLSVHRIAGSCVAGLLTFRIWWGFFGGSTARFANFLKGPRTVLSYAKGLFTKKPEALPGHNPMGGWSVAALIVCLIAQVVAGLFSTDTDGLDSGPFANLVSYDQGRLASHIHAFAFDALEALVCLHLAALAFYHVYKRQNLIGAMISGRMRSQETSFKPGHWASLLFGVALGLVVAIGLIWLSGDFSGSSF